MRDFYKPTTNVTYIPATTTLLCSVLLILSVSGQNIHH
jgi:hypothetical protein